MLTVWVVEDNPQQRADIIEAIKADFRVQVVEIRTEHEFRHQLAQMTQIPDLIVMDVMLPWTKPAPDAPQPPDEVKQAGFYRAGMRCVALARAKTETKSIKIIVLSNLDQDDLSQDLDSRDSETVYLAKSNNYVGLIDLIKQFKVG